MSNESEATITRGGNRARAKNLAAQDYQMQRPVMPPTKQQRVKGNAFQTTPTSHERTED